MVHALSEIWRTMAAGGVLLDIRPYLPFGPLELVQGGDVRLLGRLDEAEFDPGDPAADDAVAEVTRRGLFALQQTGSFYSSSYWDSVADGAFSPCGRPARSIPRATGTRSLNCANT